VGLFVLGVVQKPARLCWVVVFDWSVPRRSLAGAGPVLQLPESALVFFWFSSLNQLATQLNSTHTRREGVVGLYGNRKLSPYSESSFSLTVHFVGVW